MRPEKFTIKLREALNSAMEVASKNENPEITCEHLLAALVAQSDGLARPLCEKLGVSVPALEGRLKDAIAALAHVRGGAQPQFSNELNKVLNAADFGLPQNRERIFIVAVNRRMFPDHLFEFPEPPRPQTPPPGICTPSCTSACHRHAAFCTRTWLTPPRCAA